MVVKISSLFQFLKFDFSEKMSKIALVTTTDKQNYLSFFIAEKYLGIVLEERSKMRKQILCAVGAATLAACITISSSQPEVEAKAAVLETATVKTVNMNNVFLQQDVKPFAGIFAETLEPASFTTESDDTVSFERKYVTTVTSAYEEKVSNRWGIELTEDEIDLLAKIVWVEARGESEKGQRAVIEVIFNRMVSDLFPDTLYDVLSQKKPTQFSSWKHREKAKPTDKEYNSIYEVLNGNSNVLREDTLYFATKKLKSRLDVKIGDHYFCY